MKPVQSSPNTLLSLSGDLPVIARSSSAPAVLRRSAGAPTPPNIPQNEPQVVQADVGSAVSPLPAGAVPPNIPQNEPQATEPPVQTDAQSKEEQVSVADVGPNVPSAPSVTMKGFMNFINPLQQKVTEAAKAADRGESEDPQEAMIRLKGPDEARRRQRAERQKREDLMKQEAEKAQGDVGVIMAQDALDTQRKNLSSVEEPTFSKDDEANFKRAMNIKLAQMEPLDMLSKYEKDKDKVRKMSSEDRDIVCQLAARYRLKLMDAPVRRLSEAENTRYQEVYGRFLAPETLFAQMWEQGNISIGMLKAQKPASLSPGKNPASLSPGKNPASLSPGNLYVHEKLQTGQKTETGMDPQLKNWFEQRRALENDNSITESYIPSLHPTSEKALEHGRKAHKEAIKRTGKIRSRNPEALLTRFVPPLTQEKGRTIRELAKIFEKPKDEGGEEPTPTLLGLSERRNADLGPGLSPPTDFKNVFPLERRGGFSLPEQERISADEALAMALQEEEMLQAKKPVTMQDLVKEETAIYRAGEITHAEFIEASRARLIAAREEGIINTEQYDTYLQQLSETGQGATQAPPPPAPQPRQDDRETPGNGKAPAGGGPRQRGLR